MVYVNMFYFGNFVVDIENLVIWLIEKELQLIIGIKDIKFIFIQDYLVIMVEFFVDMDLDDVVCKVKDVVDKVKSELFNDLD